MKINQAFQIFQRATLKNTERPGYKAKFCTGEMQLLHWCAGLARYYIFIDINICMDVRPTPDVIMTSCLRKGSGMLLMNSSAI